MTHIDPKAPASSPQHPRNWRKPVFLAPGGVVADGPGVVLAPFEPQVLAEPPAAGTPVAPKKAPVKKPATRRKPANLAAALAKLGDK